MKNKIPELPKVSFLIMTFNGGNLLRQCLKSIRDQNYPSSLIEIIAIDDASEDESMEIAKSFGAKVYISGKHDIYLSQRIALHKASGDLTYIVDQDIELRGRNFIRKMIKPLIENPDIIASFTRAYPRTDQPWITRYISYHPFQCDPLFEYLTPQVEKSFIKKRKGYVLCRFKLGRIPAESRMMYRLDILKKTPNWRMERIFDHDLLVKTIKSGYNLMAYVPSAGIYHHHAKSLKHLLQKRARNLHMHYFPSNQTTEYRWLDTSNKYQVIRLFLWVIYANLFFPALIRGFWRALKFKSWILLIEPVITISTTDVILWNFIKDNTGRTIIFDVIKSIFNFKSKNVKGAFGN